MQLRYKGMNEGGERATLTFLVYDILETHYGTWFTPSQIYEQVCLLRDPAPAYDTINRIVWRLAHRGTIDIHHIDDQRRDTAIFRVETRDYLHKEDTHETPDTSVRLPADGSWRVGSVAR